LTRSGYTQPAARAFGRRQAHGAARISRLRCGVAPQVSAHPSEWPALTRRAVQEQGQPYSAAIERALHEGRISPQIAAYELRQVG